MMRQLRGERVGVATGFGGGLLGEHGTEGDGPEPAGGTLQQPAAGNHRLCLDHFISLGASSP
jgi:hypothetical protein